MEMDRPSPDRAESFMQRKVFALRPEMTLDQAAHDLLRHGFSGAPVVDVAGRVLGVLSELDCLEALAASAFDEAPAGLVADRMHRELDTIPPETDLFTVVQHFRENVHRRILVVDREGHLLGVVARRDVLRALGHARRRREAGVPETTYEGLRKRWGM
jgi:CBS domain-containing protein